MKKIYVLRHADKNRETGELTEIGRQRARELRNSLGVFNLVITSDKNSRLLETAELLTGTKPTIDHRAGIVYMFAEQKETLGKLAKIHPMTHAGAIYENSDYKDLAAKIGKDFVDLLRDTFLKLPTNGRALIVGQDAVLVAGKKHINQEPFAELETNYQPLEGYIVNENLEIEELK